jgi:uncharacterized paraquat-inducible protein A
LTISRGVIEYGMTSQHTTNKEGNKMIITIECNQKKRCGWITDIDTLNDDTNPVVCPKCGHGLHNAYDGKPYPADDEETEE